MSSDSRPTPIPLLANLRRAPSNSSLESSSALLGMQPMLRHVPPNAGRLSMHATRDPSWAARRAATYPPGPPPITIKSNMVTSKMINHRGTEAQRRQEDSSKEEDQVVSCVFGLPFAFS